VAVSLVLAVGFLMYRHRRRRGAVRFALVARALRRSRRILFNRSTRADVFYYFVNTFSIGGLIGWGILSGMGVSGWVVRGLHAEFGAAAPSTAPAWALRAGLTLVVFLAYEFGYYVDHYMKHKIPALFELHKTHHSAEVLTPLTVFRVHPIDTLIFVDIIALTTGVAYGVFTYVAGRGVDMYAIFGQNVLFVVFLFGLAQLQHSQFWIPLCGAPGRLILSPAHHQIHHSVDPAHYNRNLGSCLAIWDWMFGTLCVPPKESPGLKFGVTQTGDDPHRVFTLLVTPVASMLRALTPRSSLPAAAATPAAERTGR
jgi:sterol desaturase/sphingolipid hydroxylase (fatty acid hydroxylase superfamily)